MFQFVKKMIPTNFIILGNKEINADSLYYLLEEFSVDDNLRDYEMSNESIAKILVEEGILAFGYGERMARIYSKTDKFNNFYDKFTAEVEQFSMQEQGSCQKLTL